MNILWGGEELSQDCSVLCITGMLMVPDGTEFWVDLGLSADLTVATALFTWVFQKPSNALTPFETLPNFLLSLASSFDLNCSLLSSAHQTLQKRKALAHPGIANDSYHAGHKYIFIILLFIFFLPNWTYLSFIGKLLKFVSPGVWEIYSCLRYLISVQISKNWITHILEESTHSKGDRGLGLLGKCSLRVQACNW